MQNGWLAKAGAFTVEHVPCPHPGVKVDLSVPAKGVLHTTEGSTVEGALGVFRVANASHFVVGRDANKKVRIVQCVPLGYLSPTLKHTIPSEQTNALARVQIELVGFSQHKAWAPDSQVAAALGALLRTLVTAAQVPLHRFKNPTRGFATWQNTAGWCGHQDVPQNDHWDPGELDFQTLFNLASAAIPGATVKPRLKPLLLHPQTFRLRRRANGLVYVEPLDRPH